jgi:hypothetical protein
MSTVGFWSVFSHRQQLREAMKKSQLPENRKYESPDRADWRDSSQCRYHKITIRFGLAVLLLTTSCLVSADCVEGALTKSKFNRMNNHTIALTGGYGEAIVIRTSCRINRKSAVSILKDSFCNDDKAVLHIDGKDCDAEKVSLGDKFNEGRTTDQEEWIPD